MTLNAKLKFPTQSSTSWLKHFPKCLAACIVFDISHTLIPPPSHQNPISSPSSPQFRRVRRVANDHPVFRRDREGHGRRGYGLVRYDVRFRSGVNRFSETYLPVPSFAIHHRDTPRVRVSLTPVVDDNRKVFHALPSV